MSDAMGFNAFEKIEILDSNNEKNRIVDKTIYINSSTDKINLKVSEGILLRVNAGFKREATVGKSDLIEVGLNSIQPTKKFKFKIDNDYMNAQLECAYKAGEIFKLKEKEFTNELLIEKESVEVIESELLSAADVMKCLKDNSIIYGIQYKSFQDVIDGKEATIAIGKNPIPTIDDSLEIKFLNDNDENNESEEDKVNYLNRNKIKSVKAGDVLATIIRGKVGEEGKNIRGTRIEAKPIKAVELNLASGCKLVGNNIVATIDGMPVYSKKGNKIEVKKRYEVPINVDLKTGNINFNGEVLINGNVEENLSVYGSCGVTVKGNATITKITSLGDVNIGGKLLHSTIRSGFLESEFKIKVLSMKVIANEFKALRQDIETLINNNLLGGRKIGSIVRALLDGKYTKIERGYDFIKSDVEVLFGDIKELSALYDSKILRLACLNIKSLGEIDDILNVIEKYLYELEVIFSLESSVNIGYCEGSTVFSKGNIYIHSEGVYASDFESDDSIIFLGERSILRGGKIQAKNRIKTGVIGTMSGVVTELKVEDDGIIECEKAYYNTKFKIGNRAITLEENYKNLRVFRGEDNGITLEGLKM
ncbi:MAG: flagellar assembly protein A [Sarcina sp.]